MHGRLPRVTPIQAVADGLARIRSELHLPEAFPAAVLAAADALAAHGADAWGDRPRNDLPFVTVDPPGSRDLDQAMHLERRRDGYRVSYAIADVGAFVRPSDTIDGSGSRTARRHGAGRPRR
jgi:exoribonuclease R